MENNIDILEPLVNKVESYVKTSVELYKLKSINKLADVIASILSNTLVIILFSIAIVAVNIGFALWLGDFFGELYYGFFSIAAFYLIVGVFVYYFLRNCIKKRVRNSFISQLLN